MAFSALYLLPALAIIILFEGSGVLAKGNSVYRSRKSQRRVRHKLLFFRSLVVALCLATAVTMTTPLPDLTPIVQGLLLTAVIMVPFCVYIAINSVWPREYSNSENELAHDDIDSPDLRPANASKQSSDVPAPVSTSAATASHEASAAAPSTASRRTAAPPRKSRAGPTSQTPQKPSVKSLHNAEPAERVSALDQTLSVGEQLETLDDLVDFHDIGDEQFETATPGGQSSWLAENPLEKAIAVAREGMLEEPGIQDYSTENLPAKSRIELSEMVVRLRNDKMKLQKLVIAQKAVIDSEKQAHERTRVVVKDAISVMRHARHGQRMAEKIARRERAQRQRVEKDYTRVRRQLDNALSTLKPEQRQAAEKA